MDKTIRGPIVDLKNFRTHAVKEAEPTYAGVPGSRVPLLLSLFCLCAFVILSRPQDIFPFMAPFRPVLVLEALTLFLLFFHYSNLAPEISFNNVQIRLFVALIGAMILSIPFAHHKGLAFMFVIDYLKLALFFFLFFIIADSAGSVRRILRISCLGVLMYTIFVLVKGIEDRITAGGMFDANDLSFFIISFLPFNFLFLDRENPFYMKIVSLLNLGLGSLVILMTGSRGGFASLLLVFTMLLFSRTRTIKFAYKVMFVVLCLLLVSFKSSSIDFARLGTVFSPGSDYNVTQEWGRKDIWKRGLNILAAHPMTGVGVGCFDMAIGQSRHEEGRIPKWQTAHNSLIQVGTETGIVGLILFLLLNLYTYRAFSRTAKSGSPEDLVDIGEMARIGFAGQFITGLFLSQAYSPYWVFYIALSATFARLAQKKTDSLPYPQEALRIRKRAPLPRAV